MSSPVPGGLDASAIPTAFSDRCGVAWRSTGGGRTIGVLVPMVRQVLCTRVRRCNLLLFRQLSAVYDDAIRHWRILHQKSILPCGAYHCAAGKLPSGAPAPPPAYLTPAHAQGRDDVQGPRQQSLRSPFHRPAEETSGQTFGRPWLRRGDQAARRLSRACGTTNKRSLRQRPSQ
jgi:hypothetical protein